MEMLYRADNCDGTYRNPIIYADFSDPDVIRDEDIFYLTASSFNYTPGLPILRSYDLVNWELVNYALKNVPGDRFRIPRHSEGVWAPSIRKHNGMYYIYFGMPDEGIFMVQAPDPLGEWSEPVCLLPGKGYIDPCPLWDEDGRAYIVHAYAKSRIGFKSILGLFEMSGDGRHAVSRDRFIFDGNDPKHPAVTIEGPKIYKRDGYYYILAPAGGVPEGYQLALRSRNIEGPYEMRKILDTGDTDVNGPHQGGLVDAPDGSEWFLHFNDAGVYGRITYLEPVNWKEGWPVAGIDRNGEGCGEPVSVFRKPVVNKRAVPAYLQSSDDFKGNACGEAGFPKSPERDEEAPYGLQWQWLGNHDKSFASQGPEGLRLYALNPSGDSRPVISGSANVLTQKIICPEFSSETEADITGLKIGSRAGVAVVGGAFIGLFAEKTAKGVDICLERDGEEMMRLEQPRCRKVSFRIEFTGKVRLFYRLCCEGTEESSRESSSTEDRDGSDSGLAFIEAGNGFSLSQHHWTGVKTGIFALSPDDNGGYADFRYFRTSELT